jgi:hypothetical protein
MKSKVLFLTLCFIIFSCKKENLSNDCRLVEQISQISTNSAFYYYDQANRLVGLANWGQSVTFPSPISVILYDSIAYPSANTATVFRFEAYFTTFSKDTLPNHAKNYYSKIVTVLQNDRVVNSKLFYRKFNTNLDVLSSEKEFIYENSNITKIIETGSIKIPYSSVFNGKKTSLLSYENRNVKSVISEVLEEDGFRIGGDTLIVNAYLGFKNPFKNLQVYYDVSPVTYSENLNADYNFSYYYGNRFGVQFSSGSEKGSSPKYTDNGKNYPKELGTYLCD